MPEAVKDVEQITGQEVADTLILIWEHWNKRSGLKELREEIDKKLAEIFGNAALHDAIFDFSALSQDTKRLIHQRELLQAEVIFLDQQDELIFDVIDNKLIPVLNPAYGPKPVLHFTTRPGFDEAIHNIYSPGEKNPQETNGEFGHISPSGNIVVNGPGVYCGAIVHVFDWTDNGIEQQVDIEVIYPEQTENLSNT
jgi:hypothetical protein